MKAQPTKALINKAVVLLLFLSNVSISQNIGINGTGANAHPSAF